MSKSTTATNNQVPSLPNAPSLGPGEDDIRDYAYHLYEQGGCAPGHDVDHWVEATACLKANIPARSSHRRLHQHLNGPEGSKIHGDLM